MSKQPFNNSKRPAFLEAAIERRTPGVHSLEEIQFHNGYAEPGYSDPESGVVATGDWNPISRYDQGGRTLLCDLPERIEKILSDRYGVECEWEDEFTTCNHCNKLVRTQADSYQWKRFYAELDCEIVCGNCIAKDPSDYLAGLEGKYKSAITFDNIDPSKHGYVLLLDKQENGFHEGMAADPEVIAKSLKSKGVERFIFRITEASQFFITFACYVHEDEIELAKTGEIATDAEISPAQRLQEGLKDAVSRLATLPEGVPGGQSSGH